VRVELDPVIERLKGSLLRSYTEIFTDTGRPRSSGPLATSEERLKDLRNQLQNVQANLKDIDAQQLKYDASGAEILRLESEAIERNREAKEISQRAQDVELLQRDVENHKAKFERAQETLRRIEGDDRSLRTAEKAAAESERESLRLNETLVKLKEKESEIHGNRARADEDLRSLEAKRDKLRTEIDRTAALLKGHRLQDHLNRLRKQARQAKKHEADARRVDDEKSKLPTLTPQRMSRLEALDRRLLQLDAEIRAIGISVELTPERAAMVEARESGTAKRLTIEAATTERVQAGQRLTLQLQGWGRIQLRSGAKELKELEEELKSKRTEFSRSLADLGCESVGAAASLMEKRKDLEGQSREAQRNLTETLDGFENLSKLTEEINQKSTELDNLWIAHRVNPDEEALTLSELEAREEQLKPKLKAADLKIRQSAEALNAFAQTASDYQRDRNQTENELATLTERQRGATEQIRGIQDRYPNGLTTVLGKAQDDLSDAKALLESAQRKLPEDAEALPERNRRAARAAAQVQEELKKKQSDRDNAAGALDALGSRGLYSLESDLLGKIEAEESKARTSMYCGWGARILHDLIERRKQEATRAVLGPLQEALSSRFAYLTGDQARTVFLNEDLGIRGVGCTEQELIPFDSLSQGAKEQLLLSLRIGVAATLSEQEPQSLILDDVLVNTDPVRQERVLDLLHNTARDLQILVLTCHPDRYRGVGQAVSIQTANRES
jgi:DNA repair exonuclease SbcCD ATPase subunit